MIIHCECSVIVDDVLHVVANLKISRDCWHSILEESNFSAAANGKVAKLVTCHILFVAEQMPADAKKASAS